MAIISIRLQMDIINETPINGLQDIIEETSFKMTITVMKLYFVFQLKKKLVIQYAIKRKKSKYLVYEILGTTRIRWFLLKQR